jgi:chromosomal replication initiation ATPase DnaA
MTPRERIERLAKDLGYTMDEIRSPSRVKPLVDARSALAVHLKEQGRNKTHIGKLINRDRTSVLNLLRRVS